MIAHGFAHGFAGDLRTGLRTGLHTVQAQPGCCSNEEGAEGAEGAEGVKGGAVRYGAMRGAARHL